MITILLHLLRVVKTLRIYERMRAVKVIVTTEVNELLKSQKVKSMMMDPW